MKKFLFFLTIITFTFYSCTSDDEDPTISPFAGTWSGTYDGDDSGTWILVISDSGKLVKGSSFSNNAQATTGTAATTVAADGSVKSTSSNGTWSTSQIVGNSLTGTWYNPSNKLRGTHEGSRE